MTAFISYRRDDSADATGRIYDRLAAYFGRDAIFKDVDNIPLGVNFYNFLTDIMQDINVVLVVIGRSWVSISDQHGNRRLDDDSDFVRMEVEMALERRIPIVPLLVGGSSMPKGYELPDSIRDLVLYNGVPVRPDPDFHSDMDRLINSLEPYIIAPSMQTRPNSPTTPKSPPSHKAKTRISTPRPPSPVVKEWAAITIDDSSKQTVNSSIKATDVNDIKTLPARPRPPSRLPLWRIVLIGVAVSWPWVVWVLTDFYYNIDLVFLGSALSGVVMFMATIPLIWIQQRKRKQP